jgi:hypothetical protein
MGSVDSVPGNSGVLHSILLGSVLGIQHFHPPSLLVPGIRGCLWAQKEHLCDSAWLPHFRSVVQLSASGWARQDRAVLAARLPEPQERARRKASFCLFMAWCQLGQEVGMGGCGYLQGRVCSSPPLLSAGPCPASLLS